jgi:hypothetical protein
MTPEQIKRLKKSRHRMIKKKWGESGLSECREAEDESSQ